MALRRASRIHPLWRATHLTFHYEIGSGAGTFYMGATVRPPLDAAGGDEVWGKIGVAQAIGTIAPCPQHPKRLPATTWRRRNRITPISSGTSSRPTSLRENLRAAPGVASRD